MEENTVYLFSLYESNFKSDYVIERLLPLKGIGLSTLYSQNLKLSKATKEAVYISWKGIEGWLKPGDSLNVNSLEEGTIRLSYKGIYKLKNDDVIDDEYIILNNILYNVRTKKEHIIVPDNVKIIIRQAFRDIPFKSVIEINDNVIYLDRGVFEYSPLYDVYLSNKIKKIGINAFKNSSCEQIHYKGTPKEWRDININLSYSKGTRVYSLEG